MGTIVAISGGELTDFRSKLINGEIIRLSQKRNPKVLFIPTAADDSETILEKNGPLVPFESILKTM